MKKNSFSVLLAIVALLISGCQSKPRPRPGSSSSRPTSGATSEVTSEVSSSQQSSSLGTSEISDVTVPTSIVSSNATSSWAPTSEGTSEHTTSKTSSVATSETSSLSTSVISSSQTTSITSAGTSATSAGTSVISSSQTTSITSAGTSATSAGTSVITSASAPTTSFTSATSPITSATSDLVTSGTSSLIPAGYYSSCEGKSGSALANAIRSINEPKNPSYDWSRYEDADEAEDDPTCILSLYTRHNIKKSSHCGNYAWDKWNREHIWTQTKYPASKTDNHNIFACEGQINGFRSDKPFAEGGETVVVFGHTTGCKQTSSTFEPCDEAKGEVARSVMYGTVMYQYTMTLEIESIALCLKWHNEHPVTSREIKRNEIVYGNQGNRNPFVDHPEYATLIWG